MTIGHGAISAGAISADSAQGATTGISGAANITSSDDTVSASGKTTIVGSGSTTNANDASAASGATTVTGTLARTNANDVSSASGYTATTGTSSTTNADDTCAASGAVADLPPSKIGGDDAWHPTPHKGHDKQERAKQKRLDDELEQTLRKAWRAMQGSPEAAKAVAIAPTQAAIPTLKPSQAEKLLDLRRQQIEREDEEILMLL